MSNIGEKALNFMLNEAPVAVALEQAGIPAVEAERLANNYAVEQGPTVAQGVGVAASQERQR